MSQTITILLNYTIKSGITGKAEPMRDQKQILIKNDIIDSHLI